MFDFIFNILTFGFKKNLSYYRLIDDFRKKLSRPQNEARKITDSEIEQNPFLPNSLKYVNVLDVSTHRTSITEQDLDFFMNSIRHFDYSFMLFKNHYKSYSSNILRFKPTSNNKDFELILLQEVLKDNKLHPLKPFDVLVYHLKFKYKLSSKLYLKIKNRKKYVYHR